MAWHCGVVSAVAAISLRFRSVYVDNGFSDYYVSNRKNFELVKLLLERYMSGFQIATRKSVTVTLFCV